jgi:hypothetical protein
MGGERGIVREDRNGQSSGGTTQRKETTLEDVGVDGGILQVIKCKQGVARLCRVGVVTVRCTKHFVVQWNLQFVGSQFGICFVSLLWHLEF